MIMRGKVIDFFGHADQVGLAELRHEDFLQQPKPERLLLK